MKHDNLESLINYFKQIEGKDLKIDEAAISAEYLKNTEKQTLSIKVLSVFGGILSSLSFVLFLAISGLYESEMGIILGAVSIASAISITKTYDSIFLDTAAISFYIIGFILLFLGMDELGISENTIRIVFIIIAIAAILLVQNYIFSFVSFLIVNGCFFNYIAEQKNHDFIHIYVLTNTIFITYTFLNEAKIIAISPKLSKLYNPFRISLIISFLVGLVFIDMAKDLGEKYIWISSFTIILAILVFLTHLFPILNISMPLSKVVLSLITLLLLSPTIPSPGISGSILILLLTFRVNFKTGFGIGVISFIYFISRYYYDLNLTLLTKSILLFSSGILFLVLYLLVNKKLQPHEKL